MRIAAQRDVTFHPSSEKEVAFSRFPAVVREITGSNTTEIDFKEG
jgi:hypothetical protein